MSLAAGTRLGHYEILSPLGAGGMGEVYRATDTRLRRDVAIKVLPSDFAADPDRLRRFELLEGETLREVIAKGSLPPRKAVDIGTQIASGLAAAHAK